MKLKRYYAVRQFTSGTVTGSRAYTMRADAEREVTAWREHIGRAAVVPESRETYQAVRTEDQAALLALLAEHEPKVWVSTTSHRSRDRLEQAFRIAGEDGLGPSYGVWADDGPRGSYYEVPERLAEVIGAIKGVRVLRGEPSGGRLFKRWGQEEMGGPVRGHWATS